MARLKKNASDEDKRTRFLIELSRCGNITDSANQASIPRRTLYNWRKDSPAFKAEWDQAKELGNDALEDEARRRGHDGVEEPVYQGGEEVGRIRKYSDTLLIFLLKGNLPAKFRDRVAIGGDPENQTPINFISRESVTSDPYTDTPLDDFEPAAEATA